MKKPILVVLAAGMGSRYGGMKQIDPVGPNSQLIIDYSIYDAKKAGFETVVFIIKKEIEQAFKEAIGDRLSKHMEVRYAFQNISALPEGFTIPEGREKPWGTSHAILSAKDVVDAPFAVINADDYYGSDAFKVIFDYLSSTPDTDVFNYCMVGYMLKNTVTEHGSVARGVCEVDENDMLIDVNERTRIEKFGDEIKFTEDDGNTWTTLEEDTQVSMNLWGFKENVMGAINDGFAEFLKEAIVKNPLKCEYFIPLTVSELINGKKAQVKVLHSQDKWYGVTYKEDKPTVVNAITEMTESGKYPADLWANN